VKFELFLKAAKAIKLPAGNYIFKGNKTGNLYWFMVGSDLDKTLKFELRPGAHDYENVELARRIHRNCDKKGWHRKLAHKMKELKK